MSSGIGCYGLLTNLIESGYFVIGTVRTQEDLKKFLIFQAKAKSCNSDVQDREKTKQVIKDVSPILDSHGLFALIHNAGIVFPGPLQYISDAEFDQNDGRQCSCYCAGFLKR